MTLGVFYRFTLSPKHSAQPRSRQYRHAQGAAVCFFGARFAALPSFTVPPWWIFLVVRSKHGDGFIKCISNGDFLLKNSQPNAIAWYTRRIFQHTYVPDIEIGNAFLTHAEVIDFLVPHPAVLPRCLANAFRSLKAQRINYPWSHSYPTKT